MEALPDLTAKLALKILAGLVALGIIVGAVLYFVTGPRRAKVEAAQATGSSIQSQATAKAAQDALKITVDNQAAHSRIDVVTHEATDAIRSAPGASAPIDPAADAAGRRALCLYDAYRAQPACQQLLDADRAEPAR